MTDRTKTILKVGTQESQQGFTLLEVLVAFSILAISLSGLLSIFSGTIQRENAFADQRTAIILAQSKLATIGAETPLSVGTVAGKFSNGYGWLLEVAPYETGSPNSLLSARRATLTVLWPSANGPNSLIVQTVKVVGHE